MYASGCSVSQKWKKKTNRKNGISNIFGNIFVMGFLNFTLSSKSVDYVQVSSQNCITTKYTNFIHLFIYLFTLCYILCPCLLVKCLLVVEFFTQSYLKISSIHVPPKFICDVHKLTCRLVFACWFASNAIGYTIVSCESTLEINVQVGLQSTALGGPSDHVTVGTSLQ